MRWAGKTTTQKRLSHIGISTGGHNVGPLPRKRSIIGAPAAATVLALDTRTPRSVSARTYETECEEPVARYVKASFSVDSLSSARAMMRG